MEQMSVAVNPVGVNGRFNNTDVGNANRLATRFGDVLRYVDKWHTWLHFDSIRWDKVSDNTVIGLAKQVLTSMKEEALQLGNNPEKEAEARELGAWAYQSEKGTHLGLMVEYAKSELLATPEDFDRNPWFFNALDCTIDLYTGLTHPHTSSDMITKVAGTAYDKDADGTRFYRFIDEITGGDGGLAEYLQMVLGLSLTGDTSEKHVWFPYGDGDNGKTLLFEITGEVMGDYAEVGQTSDIIDHGGHVVKPFGIIKLVGVRRAVFAETQEGDKLNWNVLKQMSGSDTMSIEEKFKTPISSRLEAKVFIYTNVLPTVEQVGEAEWGRIRVIPFTECFSVERRECKRKDGRLIDKLRANMPAILRWLVGGELLRREYGLVEPVAVTEATKVYREESDDMTDFLAECTYKDRSAMTSLKDIYAAYKRWYQGDAWDIPKDSEIGKRVRAHGYIGKKSRGVMKYKGIGLKPGYEPEASGPFGKIYGAYVEPISTGR